MYYDYEFLLAIKLINTCSIVTSHWINKKERKFIYSVLRNEVTNQYEFSSAKTVSLIVENCSQYPFQYGEVVVARRIGILEGLKGALVYIIYSVHEWVYLCVEMVVEEVI